MRAGWLLLVLLAVACRSYVGTARDVSPRVLDEPGWLRVHGVQFLPQRSESDCGAAAIGMVVGFWTRTPPDTIAATLRPAPAAGIKAARLREVARSRSLAAFVIAGEVADLERELTAGRPILVGMVKPHRKEQLNHYEVVIALHRERRLVITLDPAEGLRQNTLEGFVAEWQATGKVTLVVSSVPTVVRLSSAATPRP
jgi:ABC-type bacteriocin/lantibiotic exporter with double-glycine peptidase domain